MCLGFEFLIEEGWLGKLRIWIVRLGSWGRKVFGVSGLGRDDILESVGFI